MPVKEWVTGIIEKSFNTQNSVTCTFEPWSYDSNSDL